MSFQFFHQSGFESGLHTRKRMTAQVRRQRVGEVSLKAGVPDAFNLLFDVGNGRHARPVDGR
jgi:hypothetical protein